MRTARAAASKIMAGPTPLSVQALRKPPAGAKAAVARQKRVHIEQGKRNLAGGAGVE